VWVEESAGSLHLVEARQAHTRSFAWPASCGGERRPSDDERRLGSRRAHCQGERVICAKLIRRGARAGTRCCRPNGVAYARPSRDDEILLVVVDVCEADAELRWLAAAARATRNGGSSQSGGPWTYLVAGDFWVMWHA
jgi:hypothetical protein